MLQGGKTDPTGAYTYTTAPNVDDITILPLGASFDLSAPPYTAESTSTAPTYAWHCLSPISSTEVFSFGGDGGTSVPVQTGSDSAWILNVSSTGVNFGHLPTTGQPMRRIYHACASAGSKIYIAGGLKDDGSNVPFADSYMFVSTSGIFTSLPSLPQPIFHHNAIMLPNGTLLVFGGASISPTTGQPALNPLSTILAIDTTSSATSWSTRTISGSAPPGRRGASASVSDDGSKVFIFGGGSATLASALADAWILDVEQGSWQQVSPGSNNPSARFDHVGVAAADDQVLILGGWTGSGPADSALYAFSMAKGAWITEFTSPTSQSSSIGPTSISGASASSESPTSMTASSASSTSSGCKFPASNNHADTPSCDERLEHVIQSTWNGQS